MQSLMLVKLFLLIMMTNQQWKENLSLFQLLGMEDNNWAVKIPDCLVQFHIFFHLSCREFVLFLLSTDVSRYNNHWSPYYRHCTPCISNFSAVIKIDSDNYQQEQTFLLKQTELAAPEIINRGNLIIIISIKSI